MRPRIVSLCSGYGGLDQAAEQVTGGTTVAHVEFDAAPSALLAYRYPGVPNLHDVADLAWALDYKADVLTAGYPCQPFSGAGKRAGLNDPRHLFPWIARGIERMRPPLVLLENVRGHLSLGFDVVLAELDRIGYDVRWTLLRAADVGAPHGRSRLWIAARAREAGGWPAPTGEPTALAEDGGWADPASGLFGPIPARRPGTAGVMVAGLRWDSDAVAVNSGTLLPTPRTGDNRNSRVALLGSNSVRHGRTAAGSASGVGLEQAVELARGDLPREFRSWDEVPGWHGTLLPTPMSSLGRGTGTPSVETAYERQVVQHKRNLDDAVALLPTPAATDAKGARNSTSGRQPGSEHHSGDTLGDLIFDGRLLPTPAVNDMGAGKTVEAWDEWTATQKAKHGNGNGHGPSSHIEAARMALLPTPQAADGQGGRTVKTEYGNLRHEVTQQWGAYAAAIARWEAITRPAPAPTEQGRNGPRLSPAFVEWMQGLPAGWVTDVPGITRNAALKMLGNGCVPAQAAAAYALLGVSPDLWLEKAA